MTASQGREICLARLERDHGPDLPPVTETVAERWCRVDAIRAYPAVGWLIAATAYEHGLTLATRNWRDFDGLPVALVNLFELAAADLSEAASTM